MQFDIKARVLPIYVQTLPSASSGGIMATSDKSQFKVLLDAHILSTVCVFVLVWVCVCVCLCVYFILFFVHASVCLCLKLNQVAAGTFGSCGTEASSFIFRVFAKFRLTSRAQTLSNTHTHTQMHTSRSGTCKQGSCVPPSVTTYPFSLFLLSSDPLILHGWTPSKPPSTNSSELWWTAKMF